MNSWNIALSRPLWLLLLLLMVGGCAPNAAYRTAEPSATCPSSGCTTAALEHHPAYDIGFVEFTDRGNVFDREQMNTLLQYIDTQANSPGGATVVVFVHGWKHNAAPADRNLQSFRNMLQSTATAKLTGNRRLIGVYIGWRGQSLDLPVAEHLTYWARKNTAHDVGKGGVTELLLRLEHTLEPKPATADPNRNVLVTIGHSFGGVVLLSALHDVLLDRVVSTETVGNAQCSKNNRDRCGNCVRTRNFGHGVILLNPAVEANELLPLKEVVAEQQCYAETQPKLLHVVSSTADIATRIAFRAGQYLGVSVSTSELPLKRTYKGKTVTLHEHGLDTTTIGNYLPFRSGVSVRRTPQNQPYCADPNSQRSECYMVCREDEPGCFTPEDAAKHIPIGSSEPLHFLYTDADFIKDHNDVFNPKVGGYIAAVVMESSYQRMKAQPQHTPAQVLAQTLPACLNDAGDKFHFPNCFDHHVNVLKQQK